jgi:hypothetical protein
MPATSSSEGDLSEFDETSRVDEIFGGGGPLPDPKTFPWGRPA